jgi:hypothetical protein
MERVFSVQGSVFRKDLVPNANVLFVFLLALIGIGIGIGIGIERGNMGFGHE